MFVVGDRVEVLESNNFCLEEGDKGIVVDTFELPSTGVQI